jgi:hypothetical protein
MNPTLEDAVGVCVHLHLMLFVCFFWGGVGGIANNWMMIPAQLGLQSNFE